jgi:AAA domain, putative AbiEii toxin, Type IV TA system/AAA ATPase domain
MLQSFTVRGFRCFRQLTMGPFDHINLIAGKNNVGKTAVLEAIHLHGYPLDCTLPFKINQQRGGEELEKFNPDLVRWLFFEKRASDGLEFKSEDPAGRVRWTRMWLVDGLTVRERFPEIDKVLQSTFLAAAQEPNLPRLIQRSEINGQARFAVGVPKGSGLSSVGSSESAADGPSVLLESGMARSQEDVKAFSDMESGKRQDRILPWLRVLEPRLQRLVLLVLAGTPVIHGDLEGLSQLVPMSFMGEGLRRLLSILLAIDKAAGGGTVLVDEIENGLHYSVVKDVWRAIAQAARQADVQVFATTHSYECVQAAHRAITENGPYDLRLLRLERLDGEVRAAAYNQTTLETSFDMNLEVR